MEKVIDLLLAWQGCCYCSSGCYNYFTDTDNRSCDSVFLLFLQLFLLFSFMAEEKEIINENLCRVSEKKPCAKS